MELGSMPIGTIIEIPLDGTNTEFIVVHHGKPSSLYDDSFLNSTILLQKSIRYTAQWCYSTDTAENSYTDSRIHTSLNSNFLESLPANVRSAMKEVKIPYSTGGTTPTIYTQQNGLTTFAFVLSAIETGVTSIIYNLPADGSKFDFFVDASTRIAYSQSLGTAQNWWTRSPNSSGTTNSFTVSSSGILANTANTSYSTLRPAFVLPDSFTLDIEPPPEPPIEPPEIIIPQLSYNTIVIPSIKVISQSLDFLGDVTGYTSLIYIRRWNTPSEFTITTNMRSIGASLLVPGNLIMLDEDGHHNGIIQDLEIKETAHGSVATVKGNSLAVLASRRLTVPPTDSLNMGYDNVPKVVTQPPPYPSPIPVESVMKEYVRRHMSNIDPVRYFSGLYIVPTLGRGTLAMWMSRFENLDQVLRQISEYYQMGWEIWIDLQNKRIVFDVIPGVDRSVPASGEHVIFSREFANISELTYTNNTTTKKNVGYVGGAGQDENRLIQTVWEGTRPEGWDRRETFIDAGSLELADGLTEEGLHRLQEFYVSATIAASVLAQGPMLYQRDWNLGDLVTIRSEELYIELDARITEVHETYEATNLRISAVFGTPPPNIIRTIRRMTQTNVR